MGNWEPFEWEVTVFYVQFQILGIHRTQIQNTYEEKRTVFRSVLLDPPSIKRSVRLQLPQLCITPRTTTNHIVLALSGHNKLTTHLLLVQPCQ